MLLEAPAFAMIPGPEAVESLAVDAKKQRLLLTLRHSLAAGCGFWRLRLTPPLATLGRKALEQNLRSATKEMKDSYVAIADSPQEIVIPFAQLLNRQEAGKTCGVEVLGLSAELVPGLTLFNRRVEVS